MTLPSTRAAQDVHCSTQGFFRCCLKMNNTGKGNHPKDTRHVALILVDRVTEAIYSRLLIGLFHFTWYNGYHLFVQCWLCQGHGKRGLLKWLQFTRVIVHHRVFVDQWWMVVDTTGLVLYLIMTTTHYGPRVLPCLMLRIKKLITDWPTINPGSLAWMHYV